jgi:hypothetical protein
MARDDDRKPALALAREARESGATDRGGSGSRLAHAAEHGDARCIGRSAMASATSAAASRTSSTRSRLSPPSSPAGPGRRRHLEGEGRRPLSLHGDIRRRLRGPEQEVAHGRGVPPHAAVSGPHLVAVQALGGRTQGRTTRTLALDPANHRLRHERGPTVPHSARRLHREPLLGALADQPPRRTGGEGGEQPSDSACRSEATAQRGCSGTMRDSC